jgi:outer membrane lipoprotein SlyB
MRGKFVRSILLPLALAAGVGACASGGVQPGFVQTANSVTPPPGSSGRVVSINDVSLQGGGGSSGSGRGPLIGGLVGAGGGAAIGAATSHSVVGGLVGGVLGAVGGAIAGTIVDSRGGAMSGGRGIQVTVQSDDGQTAVVAQRDDGDIQLGDRVQIVQGPGGVPKVVRENSRAPDTQQSRPSQYGSGQYAGNQYGGGQYGGGQYGSGRYGGGQYGGGQYGGGQYGGGQYGGGQYGGAPQDYGPSPGHGPVSRDYTPPQDYRQPQGSYSSSSPQDDPRYGSLN